MSPILGIIASQQSGHISYGSYDSIATYNVGAGGITTTTFSSIPSTYKHLQIRISGVLSAADGSILMRANGDTGNNYQAHYLYGTGNTAVGGDNSVPTSYWYMSSGCGTQPTAVIMNLLEYTNTNKNKVGLSLTGTEKNGAGNVWWFSGSWNNTSAINSLTIYTGSGTINQYTSIALYGIKG